MSGDLDTSAWVSCSNLYFSDFLSLLSFFICVRRFLLWFLKRESSSLSGLLTLFLMSFSSSFKLSICSNNVWLRFFKHRFSSSSSYKCFMSSSFVIIVLLYTFLHIYRMVLDLSMCREKHIYTWWQREKKARWLQHTKCIQTTGRIKNIFVHQHKNQSNGSLMEGWVLYLNFDQVSSGLSFIANRLDPGSITRGELARLICQRPLRKRKFKGTDLVYRWPKLIPGGLGSIPTPAYPPTGERWGPHPPHHTSRFHQC